MKTAINSSKNKAVAIFCFAIAVIFFSSCSKLAEELIPEEPEIENILVEESPWVFFRYENSFIDDDDDSGLSSQEIESDLNQYFVGISFTFNADGTGFIDIPEQGREDWDWTLNNNHLRTISDSQTDGYSFFSADRNQMTFESRTTTVHTKDSVQYNVTHVGKYFFR